MGEGGSFSHHELTSLGVGHHMSHPCSKCHTALQHLPGAPPAPAPRGGAGMAQGHLSMAPPGAVLIIPPCLYFLYKEWENWACYHPGQGSYAPVRGLEAYHQVLGTIELCSAGSSAFILWPSRVLFPRPASSLSGNYLWTRAELLQLKVVAVDRCQCNTWARTSCLQALSTGRQRCPLTETEM